MKPGTANGYCWKVNLSDWFGRVFERDDHLVVLPVGVGLVGQVDSQGGKSQANEDPQAAVSSEQVPVKSVASPCTVDLLA